MKTTFINGWLRAICIMLFLTIMGCQEKRQEIRNQETKKASPTFKTVMKAPDDNFAKAQEAFSHQAYKTSAEDIRLTIPYLRDLASVSDEKGQNVIERTVTSLEDLAHNVETGHVKSSEKLDVYLGFVCANLVHSEIVAAENVLKPGDRLQAGNLLDNSLKHFNEASEYVAIPANDQRFVQDLEALDKVIKQDTTTTLDQYHEKFVQLKKDLQTAQDQMRKAAS